MRRGDGHAGGSSPHTLYTKAFGTLYTKALGTLCGALVFLFLPGVTPHSPGEPRSENENNHGPTHNVSPLDTLAHVSKALAGGAAGRASCRAENDPRRSSCSVDDDHPLDLRPLRGYEPGEVRAAGQPICR